MEDILTLTEDFKDLQYFPQVLAQDKIDETNICMTWFLG